MSIICCPECKHEISDKAPYCIYCGFPINNTNNSYLSRENENINMNNIAAINVKNRNENHNSVNTMESVDLWGVELLNVENKKIKAIKITRELFPFSLVEAKRLIEQSRVIVVHNLPQNKANRIMEEYRINGIDARIFKEVRG